MGRYWSVEDCCWVEASPPPPETVTDEVAEPREELQEALS
jgi:hypothetical protein